MLRELVHRGVAELDGAEADRRVALLLRGEELLIAYLRETAHICLDPGERLRRLAIALETELAS